MDLQKKWDGVWKMKFIQQYKNLSKEIYILFFGRVVTSMGSLIWPLLTLILKNKLGYNATTIATITMAMSILQFPMLLLGGKLADTMNRKKLSFAVIWLQLFLILSAVCCRCLDIALHFFILPECLRQLKVHPMMRWLQI